MAPATAELCLRAARAADAPCLGVLATQVFLDTYATGGIRPAVAREVLAAFRSPSHRGASAAGCCMSPTAARSSTSRARRTRTAFSPA